MTGSEVGTIRGAEGRSPSPRKPVGGALSGLALVVVLSAQLAVVLDFSIVNVALPSLSSELHASATSVQWVVTAYAITFGGLLVLGGRAADLFIPEAFRIIGTPPFLPSKSMNYLVRS